MNPKQVFILLLSLLYSAWSVANAITPLQQASQERGFFFFYSASCPHCQYFAPILKNFSQDYGFKVLAISLDGGYLPSFPESVMDEGQKKPFHVRVLPSLFLVNPKTKQAALVTEGAIEEKELLRRVVTILRQQQESKYNE